MFYTLMWFGTGPYFVAKINGRKIYIEVSPTMNLYDGLKIVTLMVSAKYQRYNKNIQIMNLGVGNNCIQTSTIPRQL